MTALLIRITLSAEKNHRDAQTQKGRGLHNDVIGNTVESERTTL